MTTASQLHIVAVQILVFTHLVAFTDKRMRQIIATTILSVLHAVAMAPNALHFCNAINLVPPMPNVHPLLQVPAALHPYLPLQLPFKALICY